MPLGFTATRFCVVLEPNLVPGGILKRYLLIDVLCLLSTFGWFVLCHEPRVEILFHDSIEHLFQVRGAEFIQCSLLGSNVLGIEM